ncbi:MAG: hypothetical protein ACRCWQ_06450 [Bacilli bacterium]
MKKEDEKLKMYEKQIQVISAKYRDRVGVIPSKKVYNYATELIALVERAGASENIEHALEIVLCVLTECIEMLAYTESEYEMECVVSDVFRYVLRILIDGVELDVETRTRLFNTLVEHSETDVFTRREEYQIELLTRCSDFADIEALRARFIIKIDELIQTNAYKKRNVERLLKLHYSLLQSYETEIEVFAFLNMYVNYELFREQLIRKYFQEKKFDEGIACAIEGEAQDFKKNRLVSKWKRLRYESYSGSGLVNQQRELAKEFILAGYFSYYDDFRDLSREYRETYYLELKQDLVNKGPSAENTYRQLILQEKDYDALLIYTKKNPAKIVDFAGTLVEKYEQETLELYERYIHEEACIAKNRTEYRNVCNLIQRLREVVGNERADEVENDMCLRYTHRPAFLEELRRK